MSWLPDALFAASAIIAGGPYLLMNKSRAWIVEEYIPDGADERDAHRNRSRFDHWKMQRKLRERTTHQYGLSLKDDPASCIYCEKKHVFIVGGPQLPPEQCPKAPLKRPGYWRIVRIDRDRWEGVRRRDRMVLEEGMEAIRRHLASNIRGTYRLRNIRTEDIILGDILKADLVLLQDAAMNQASTMGVSSASNPWVGGYHSKN
jgi:hypothetical protein